jgi:hypothetical protein
MKTTLKALLVLCVLSFGVLMHADVTVGNYDSGNCFPFMCNDSGTSVGQSIDYQQAYNSGKFSGATTINSLTWYYASAIGGNPIALGGSYSFYWGYSAVGLNLSSNLASNYNGSANFLGTATIPVGGINDDPTLTLSGFTPFTYNPALGDLILEIVVTNQDNVPNGSGNGYNEADYTGVDTLRAYCLTNVGCFGATTGALVTTFGTGSTTPEPGTLVMFGSGILGLAGVIRRKLSL